MLGSVEDLQRYRVTFSKSKLHRMNQNSSFLEGSFSNRDNFKVPIQLRKESQSQYLKRSHQQCQCYQTGQMKPVKFFSMEINKPFPAPFHSFSQTNSEQFFIITTEIQSQSDAFKTLSWCAAGPFLPHGEKVPLQPQLATLLVVVSQ